MKRLWLFLFGLQLLLYPMQALAGELPEGFVPKDYVLYSPARFTQSISVTDGRDSIIPVPRTKLEEKWRVPGGLVGISGWKSDLYQAPLVRLVGVENIPVMNSRGYLQNNRGWVREYPDGMRFIDVLSNEKSGEVFEIREAEKHGGKWKRFVSYSDPDARPFSYRRVSVTKCAGCHNQAGTGNYSAGLIPGSDTVLSEGFVELEKAGAKLPKR